MGSGILVSQAFGAKDFAAVRCAVGTSTVLMGLIGLVVLAVGETATPMILEWTRTPPAVLPQATVYMRIFLLSLPLGMTMMLLRNMLQGVGDSRTFLHYQAGSLLLTAAWTRC